MKIISFIYFLFTMVGLTAQDPFFSKAKSSATIMSPGQIGAFDGTYRAGLSYRSQWFSFDNSGGFSSYRASADYHLNAAQNDYWSVSFDALNDVSGDANLRMTFVNLGASYTMNLAKRKDVFNTLRFGTQIGFGQNSLSWKDLWFGRQYDLLLFQVDKGIDNGEVGYVDGRTNGSLYPNVNIGLNYRGSINKMSSIEIDFSAHHLNKPDFGLSDFDSSLERKFNLLLIYEYKLSRSLNIKPNYFLSLQGPAQQHTLGSSVDFENDIDNSFGLFLNGRFIKNASGYGMDALILGAEARVNAISFGLSYDVYVSNVSNGNRRQGAFEFHLGYVSQSY